MNREASAVNTERLTECALCGSGSVEIVSDPIEIKYKGSTYTVTGIERERCAECGEEFFAPGQTDEILRVAAGMARKDKGLLSPEEIRQLRADLRLRQTDLEELLGVGPKSVTRWEKGTVAQSAAVDRIMRMLWQEPETITRLLGTFDMEIRAKDADSAYVEWTAVTPSTTWASLVFTAATVAPSPVASSDERVLTDGIDLDYAFAA